MSAQLATPLERATDEAWSTPLDKLDVSKAERFASNTHWPFFERLRKEAPVHYGVSPEFGPFWSITRFEDIIAIETNHNVFSSEKSISIGDNDGGESGADGFELRLPFRGRLLGAEPDLLELLRELPGDEIQNLLRLRRAGGIFDAGIDVLRVLAEDHHVHFFGMFHR